VIEHLCSMYKALSSNPCTAKNKKESSTLENLICPPTNTHTHTHTHTHMNTLTAHLEHNSNLTETEVRYRKGICK
jgi:hypothetical protein